MANAPKDEIETLNNFIFRETLPCWVTEMRGHKPSQRVDALEAQDDVVAPDDGGFDALAGLVTATYRNGDQVETRILASAALAEVRFLRPRLRACVSRASRADPGRYHQGDPVSRRLSHAFVGRSRTILLHRRPS